MVAISLYRGNLHRVSDVPRRWPMPKHRLSLRDFKLLTGKRSGALSRLRPSTTKQKPDQQQGEEEEEGMGDNGCSKQQHLDIAPNPPNINDNAPALSPQEDAPSKSKQTDGSDGRDDLEAERGSASKDSPAEKKADEAKIADVRKISISHSNPISIFFFFHHYDLDIKLLNCGVIVI